MGPSVERRSGRQRGPALSVTLALVFTATFLLLAVPAAAQDPEGGLQLHAGASLGTFWTGQESLYSSDLGHVSLEPGAVGGFDLLARVPAWRLDLGVSVERTLGAGGVLTKKRICTEVCILIVRSGFERHPFDADLTLVSGHVDFHPFPRLWRARPFLSAGYGVAFYDFEGVSVPGTVSARLPTDTDAAVYRLGAGVSLPVGDVELLARLNSYLGGYDTPRADDATWQQQLTGTAGLLYRIR